MNSTLTTNAPQSVLPNPLSKSLVFIDPDLDDYQTLAGGVLPGAEIIILDKNGNGVEQITAKLQTIAAAGGTVDQVHIFSHGTSGSLQLGSATLNSDNLPEYESQLQGWRNALSDTADIVLYGCDVAAGSGIDFVDRLGDLTGADIAASTDLTGSSGNWYLEYAKGVIEAPLALTPEAMADYQGTLRTITVTNTNDRGAGSLRDAIASAANGDTIKFAASLATRTITLTSGQLVINKNLTIEAGNAGQLTISGNNSSRVISTQGSTNVTLKNLIIANGRVFGNDPNNEATTAGGGIQTGGNSTLTLENCQVKNNVAGFGGGIHTGFRSTTTIINSKFSGNDGSLASNTERGGGAIATKSGSSLTIRDSEFTDNKGTYGGAVNNLLGSLTIDNSKFIRNVATTDVGGGVYVDGANGSGPGGFPGPVGGNVIIRNSLFDGNIAGAGGAAYLFGYGSDKMLLENSYFMNNRAIAQEGQGGGVHQANADLTVRNCFFANNSATTHGGGMWAANDGNVNISNTTFFGNTARNTGGGMLIHRTDSFSTNIVNSTFSNNNAGDYGGAIGVFKIPENAPITITSSIFDRNTANNPYRARQQTSWELTDGGNNIQFPNKETPNWSTDNNATANITIADPLLGPLQYINGMFVRLPIPGSPALRMRAGALLPGSSRALLPNNNGSATDISDSFALGATLVPTDSPSDSQAAIETDPQSDSQAAIETDPQSDSQAAIETDPQSDSQTAIETKPQSDSQTAIETKPQSDSQTAIETKPQSDSQTAIETKPQTDSQTAIETKPQSDSQTAIETKPQSDSQTAIETKPQTDSQTAIETKPQTDSQTAIETKPQTDSQTAIETNPQTDSQTAIETEDPTKSEPPTPPKTPTKSEAPTPLIDTPTETEAPTPLIDTPTETEAPTPLIDTPTE
ncbi:DUF4347 domain-containing protein, partial [Microcoleus sp. AR_TQ3_B6]|uniref:DUF4347 domain-containing protein n=1 Tax=Microcoleus sp. AR_TQ3_B6 TaxID=3055284 RepID=UPI002FD601BE